MRDLRRMFARIRQLSPRKPSPTPVVASTDDAVGGDEGVTAPDRWMQFFAEKIDGSPCEYQR
eukprot:14536557-Alexandrium_andersonii.AAC.1